MLRQTDLIGVWVYVGSRTAKERNARSEGINVYRMDPESGNWTHVQLVKDLVMGRRHRARGSRART